MEVQHTGHMAVIGHSVHKTKIIGVHSFSERAVTGDNYKMLFRYYIMPKTIHFSASP